MHKVANLIQGIKHGIELSNMTRTTTIKSIYLGIHNRQELATP